MPSFDRFETCLVGIMILASVTPLFSGTTKLLAYILLAVVALNHRQASKNISRAIVPLLLTVFGVSFGFIMDLTSGTPALTHALGTNALFLAGLVAGWAIASTVSGDRMMELLGFWATVFAGLSLVGVAFYMFLPGVISSFPTYTYEYTHHTLGITNFLFQDGTLVRRNAGIASEPGLFQLVLNLGAAAYLGNAPRALTGRWLAGITVIGLALFETRSTTGLALFAALLLIASVRSPRILAMVAVLMAIAGSAIRLEYQYQVQYKLDGTASFESRAMPARAILDEITHSPLGVGTAAYNLKYEENAWGSYDSWTQILIRFGLPLTLIIIALLIRSFRRQPLAVFVIIVTMFSQPIWAMPLVAYFYYCRPLPKVEGSAPYVNARHVYPVRPIRQLSGDGSSAG